MTMAGMEEAMGGTTGETMETLERTMGESMARVGQSMARVEVTNTLRARVPMRIQVLL